MVQAFQDNGGESKETMGKVSISFSIAKSSVEMAKNYNGFLIILLEGIETGLGKNIETFLTDKKRIWSNVADPLGRAL